MWRFASFLLPYVGLIYAVNSGCPRFRARKREANSAGARRKYARKKRQLFPPFTAHTENPVHELNAIQQGKSKVCQE
jgi:hypothetical protein